MSDIIIHKQEFNYQRINDGIGYVEPILESIDVKFSIEGEKLIMGSEFNFSLDELIYTGNVVDIKTCVINRLRRYFKFDEI